jgi:hypothetical protein
VNDYKLHIPSLGSQRQTKDPIVYARFYHPEGGLFLAYEGGQLGKNYGMCTCTGSKKCPACDKAMAKKNKDLGPYILFGLLDPAIGAGYEYLSEDDLAGAGWELDEEFRPLPLKLVKKQEGI